MDEDSTKRLSHLSLSFQTCSQPEGHPHWLCDYDPMTHIHAESRFPWLHSSRTPLKHIWSQSKEQGELQPFSRSFTRAVHTANTSSTQPYTTHPSLTSPEKWGSGLYLSLCKAGGQTERAKPVPTGKLLAQLHFGGLSHSIPLTAGKSCRDWGDR